MLRSAERLVLAKVVNGCGWRLRDAVFSHEQIPPYDENPVDISAEIDQVRKTLEQVELCLIGGSTRFLGDERKVRP